LLTLNIFGSKKKFYLAVKSLLEYFIKNSLKLKVAFIKKAITTEEPFHSCVVTLGFVLKYNFFGYYLFKI